MASARSWFDPTPRFSIPRLAAGIFAGLIGGLAIGAIMSLPAVLGNQRAFEQTGLLTLVSEAIGTNNLGVLWAIHSFNAMLFGLIFALFVAPHNVRRTLPLALAWALILWFVGSFLILRLLVGIPLTFDGGAILNLLGHLVYGVLLGLVYVAFFREEVRTIADHEERPALHASKR